MTLPCKRTKCPHCIVCTTTINRSTISFRIPSTDDCDRAFVHYSCTPNIVLARRRTGPGDWLDSFSVKACLDHRPCCVVRLRMSTSKTAFPKTPSDQCWTGRIRFLLAIPMPKNRPLQAARIRWTRNPRSSQYWTTNSKRQSKKPVRTLLNPSRSTMQVTMEPAWSLPTHPQWTKPLRSVYKLVQK